MTGPPRRLATRRPIRRWALAAAVVASVALAADRLLARMPTGRRPLSGPVRVGVEIEAPIKAVWAVLSDIPGQIRWMPEMKEVEILTPLPVGEGTIGEALVRILGIGVRDRVEITIFRPPSAFGIRHDGRFQGSGLIELRPGLDGTTTVVEWTEELVPPILPHLGWVLQRPMITHLYQRDLFLLRNIVEDSPPAGITQSA
ncbi:MAG TPA: SRPBCC family protein [Candidatus Saccharimonadales bacterium]|nr:SRPBCC family protein [Candidatus Saccharimonadales bacterium]